MKKLISFFLLGFLSFSSFAQSQVLPEDVQVNCSSGTVRVKGVYDGMSMYPSVAAGYVQGIDFVQLVEQRCKSNQIKLSSYSDVLNLPIYTFVCTAPTNNICGNSHSHKALEKILDDEFGRGFTDNFGVIGEVVSVSSFAKEFQSIMQCHNVNWDNAYQNLLSKYGKANKERANRELSALKSECKKLLSLTPKYFIEKNRKMLNR